MNTTPLQQLSEAGVAVWLDDLSRQLIESGQLAKLISTPNGVGATSNPTIFAKASEDVGPYEDSFVELARAGVSVEDAAKKLMTDDVRSACDVFAPVFEQTNGLDGRVSIEVTPDIAHDTDDTIAQARDLWETVDRPHLFVKIPATREGLAAITAATAEGISVNVTLIVSLDRYRAVMNAYMTGLEQAQQAGRDLGECHPGPYLSVPGAWIWAHARRPRALLTRSTLARIATRCGFDRFSSGSRSAGGNWARGTDWDSGLGVVCGRAALGTFGGSGCLSAEHALVDGANFDLGSAKKCGPRRGHRGRVPHNAPRTTALGPSCHHRNQFPPARELPPVPRPGDGGGERRDGYRILAVVLEETPRRAAYRRPHNFGRRRIRRLCPNSYGVAQFLTHRQRCCPQLRRKP